jgi:hypothetical protein
VTEAGTVAAVLLLLSVTTAPPTGAALPSVTVPVLLTPPVTAVGFTLTPFKAAGGFSVIVEILDAPTNVAVMLTCVTVVTVFVVTAKLALVAPCRHGDRCWNRYCSRITAPQRHHGTARRRRGTKRDGTSAIPIRAARQVARIQRHRSQRRADGSCVAFGR